MRRSVLSCALLMMAMLSVLLVMGFESINAQQVDDSSADVGSYGFDSTVTTAAVGNGFSPYAGTKMYIVTSSGDTLSRAGLRPSQPRGTSWIRYGLGFEFGLGLGQCG